MYSLHGTGIGRGVAIGTALIWDQNRSAIPMHRLAAADIDKEIARFTHAIALVRSELKRVQDTLPDSAPPETAAFIDVHLMMLDDPVIAKEPITSISEQKLNAEWALKNHSDTLIAFFDGISDPYLRTKKEDVAQVVDRIMDVLLRSDTVVPHGAQDLDQPLDGRIIVARDVSPADAIMLRHRNMAAFITSLGGPISHTAILARSLGIPAIVGMHEVLSTIRDGDSLIVDAASGAVIIEPDANALDFFERREDEHRDRQSRLANILSHKIVTQDNEPVTLLANIELPDDLAALGDSGAAGVGLYRTEFLFMNRDEPPSEGEQYEAYCHVLKSVQGPVTIRTLDLGADKQVGGGRVEPKVQMTPALGLRAIRLCLSEPSLFKPQLRAIFRAAVFGQARVMIPMLSSLQELEQSLAIIREVRAELERENIPFSSEVPIGGMIEVPAAAISADLFARKLDFLSIGTNDLIQYTLAIDRVDDSVNYLYDPLHPSVLRLIQTVLAAGREAGIPVAMCGEMAGDTHFTRLLLGLGLREFSMEPSQMLEVRQQILESRIESVEPLARTILACTDTHELHQHIEFINAKGPA
ncbi:MAG: phosphoenolpyruvate--protein phosphotransferase [Gammaproteobacteria bacterium]